MGIQTLFEKVEELYRMGGELRVEDEGFTFFVFSIDT